jgi:hypothetical protein
MLFPVALEEKHKDYKTVKKWVKIYIGMGNVLNNHVDRHVLFYIVRQNFDGLRFCFFVSTAAFFPISHGPTRTHADFFFFFSRLT